MLLTNDQLRLFPFRCEQYKEKSNSRRMESPSMLAPTTNVVGSTPTIPFIHRYYILLKGHYFLFFSAFGMLYPILNVTLRSRGLSNMEISYINLIVPFIVFFTNPLMGLTADHTRRYLFVFNLVLFITTVFYSIMFLLPSIKTNHIQATILSDEQTNSRLLEFCASQEVATKCSSRSACGCSYESHCSKGNEKFYFNFSMNASHTREESSNAVCGIQYQVPIDNYLGEYRSKLPIIDDNIGPLAKCEIICSIPFYCQGVRHPHQAHSIFFYSILFILGTNFLSNSITLGASIGFVTLPRPDLFGEQRVWGTIGFGLSAYAASLLFSIFQTELVYIIMFSITTLICIGVTSFIHIHLPNSKRNEQEMINLSDERHLSKGRDKKDRSKIRATALIPLMKKLDVMIFLSLTFIWGMSYAALDPYVYLYIDEIAPCQSRKIIGLMSLIAAISEVIAFYLAGRLIKLFGMNFSSVLIFLAFAIRFSGYYYIQKPYYLLMVETMHFFNFGILYVLIAQKADSIAPPGLSGTLQGVVYGVTFGLGRGTGLIASSFIYTRLQSRLLFLIFAICNLIAAIVYGIYFLLCKKHPQKSRGSNANPHIPKIVIDSESTVPEEPFLASSSNPNH